MPMPMPMLTHEERVARNLAFTQVLAAVAACPDRGSVLPVSRQPECGCAELTECRAGRGRTPGQVTSTECVRCRTEALDAAPEGT